MLYFRFVSDPGEFHHQWIFDTKGRRYFVVSLACFLLTFWEFQGHSRITGFFSDKMISWTNKQKKTGKHRTSGTFFLGNWLSSLTFRCVSKTATAVVVETQVTMKSPRTSMQEDIPRFDASKVSNMKRWDSLQDGPLLYPYFIKGVITDNSYIYITPTININGQTSMGFTGVKLHPQKEEL